MGQIQVGCCGSKCGQPTVVSIDDHVPKPLHGRGGQQRDSAPEWLSALAPHLDGDEFDQAVDAWRLCGEELERRTRAFVQRAVCGVPCGLVDQRVGKAVPAKYSLSERLDTLTIQIGEGHSQWRDEQKRFQECRLSEIRNIWVCVDSELVRRVHRALCNGQNLIPELVNLLLIDVPSGPVGLVERSVESREDFMDCMAVLIATQRLRNEPEAACCRRAEGPPPPEARLRPLGKSLQSMHISGPICKWLAHVGDSVLLSEEKGHDEAAVAAAEELTGRSA